MRNVVFVILARVLLWILLQYLNDLPAAVEVSAMDFGFAIYYVSCPMDSPDASVLAHPDD